eukprot:SAG22_NODE_1478_length_4327_cov_3.241249_6_plen_67_part_00
MLLHVQAGLRPVGGAARLLQAFRRGRAGFGGSRQLRILSIICGCGWLLLRRCFRGLRTFLLRGDLH